MAAREFESGANRDTEEGKNDPEAALSPAVLLEFAQYMHDHNVKAEGGIRPDDNWQKGIPLDAYMKSLLRHVFDLWLLHRGGTPVRPEDGSVVTWTDALGGTMFNLQGYWFEHLQRSVTADPETKEPYVGYEILATYPPPAPFPYPLNTTEART